jgi:peptide deformylase
MYSATHDWGVIENHKFEVPQLNEMKKSCQTHCFSTLNHNLGFCYNDSRVVKWVLKQAAREVDQVDGSLVRLVDNMVETMYDSEGAGLAAPQVGVQKRLFVYDVGEGPEVMINPSIVELDGEWYYDEGCLSIPGLRLGIVRPNRVHIRGYDLDGEEISVEADEFLGRVFQHEVDHLDGVLMLERLDDDMRRQALRVLRDRELGLDTSAMEAKLVSADTQPEV